MITQKNQYLFLIIFFIFISVSGIYGDDTNVRLWHSFRDNEEKSLNYIIKKFNLLNADCQIIFKHIDADSFTTIVENSYRNQDGPDLFVWANDRLGDWAEKKVIMPLDEFVDFANQSEYITAAVNALKYKKKLFGLPIALECLALFYNKKYIDSAPATFNELIKLAKDFIIGYKNRYGLIYGYDDFYFHSVLLHSFGGQVFDANNKYALTDTALQKSLELSIRLLNEKITPVIPQGVSFWDYQLQLFNNDSALFLISGPWIIGSLKSDNWSVSTLPRFDEHNYMSPFLGVKAVYITNKNRTSDKLKNTIKAAKYLASGDAGAIAGNIGGIIPANVNAYNDNVLSDNYCALVFRDQAMKSTPLPNIPEMSAVWQIMNNASATDFGLIRSCQIGNIKPQDAVKFGISQFNRLTAKIKSKSQSQSQLNLKLK